jgi:uncharacterized protein (TIGR03435 family)
MKLIRSALSLCLAVFCSHGAFAQSGGGTPAFDVASVKLADPQMQWSRQGSGSTSPEYTNVDLMQLLTLAYGVKVYQISGPSWISNAMGSRERYVIHAKYPAGTPKDQVNLMLQALLVEHFNMKLHREKKELRVYGLEVDSGGPKLKKAAGSGNIDVGGHQGQVKGSRTTLEMFADMLSREVGRPVLDMTHLQGYFDVTLNWTPDSAATGSEGKLDAGDSVFTAIREQLGLRLVPQKAPIDVLVIDHLEKVPTED